MPAGRCVIRSASLVAGISDRASDTGCRTATTAGAVRFVISTTVDDIQLNSAERALLAGLNVAEDPRFWNQHNGVALAAWRDPAFKAGARDRACAPRRDRRLARQSGSDS